MKKFISCFLIFALSLSMSPVQVFAQDLAYKPAFSFEYDNYQLGKTNTKQFIANLEDDMLNSYEDYWDPLTKPWLGEKMIGTPEHLAQSYNAFLYYNIYPELDDYLWNYTGLVPDGKTAEVDVLRILDYHLTASKEVAELFAKNPEYIQNKREKQIKMVPVYAVLLALAYVSWSIAPEAFSLTIPCTSIVVTIPKWASFIALMAADILITDEVAWGMEKLDERLFQLVDSYESSTFKILYSKADLMAPYRRLTNKPDGTDLMKPVIETEMENIERLLKKKYPRTKWYDPLASGDGQLLKRYFKYGYRSIDDMYKPRLKKILGEFLYDLFDGDEELINEYFRKEMLRTYYALEFIRDELSNKNDPLRFDRAMIDLATTYKVQNIQIIDGRMRKIRANPEVRSFGQNLQKLHGSCDINNNEHSDVINYINQRTEELLGAELADQTSVATTYPTMLTRAEVNYLVQLIDMKRQKDNNKAWQDIKDRVKTRERDTPSRASDYRVQQIANDDINRRVNKVHSTGYYNLSGTK